MTDRLTPEAVKAALDGATPGPWRIVPYDAGDVSEWGIYTPMIDGSEEADRAVVHWAGFKQKYWQSADGNQKEIEANADLIAMAPDLARDWLRLKEVEKAANVMDATLAQIEGQKVYSPIDGFARLHETDASKQARRARAVFRAAVEGK